MQNQEEQMMEKLASNKKTGYLHENFRLFHIKDRKEQLFEFHYHDFHKIVIPISGDITYIIEGKSYYLNPYDILLVGHYEIHKPVISANSCYERIVIWIKNEFIEAQSPDKDDISLCFSQAISERFGLVRMQQKERIYMQELLQQLEETLSSFDYASDLLSTTYFLQFMISLNRLFFISLQKKDQSILKYDRQIEEILTFINANLTENLTNDKLAERFFLSKYHLMHKFKKETGYTLHYYIEQKRLVCASARIKEGTPVTKAALESGFMDYSTFLRAFRKKYHTSPRDYFKL